MCCRPAVQPAAWMARLLPFLVGRWLTAKNKRLSSEGNLLTPLGFQPLLCKLAAFIAAPQTWRVGVEIGGKRGWEANSFIGWEVSRCHIDFEILGPASRLERWQDQDLIVSREATWGKVTVDSCPMYPVVFPSRPCMWSTSAGVWGESWKQTEGLLLAVFWEWIVPWIPPGRN
jgi:hypothetical protein